MLRLNEKFESKYLLSCLFHSKKFFGGFFGFVCVSAFPFCPQSPILVSKLGRLVWRYFKWKKSKRRLPSGGSNFHKQTREIKNPKWLLNLSEFSSICVDSHHRDFHSGNNYNKSMHASLSSHSEQFCVVTKNLLRKEI